MDYSRIPDELKNMNQWVCCWDSSKVPMKAFEYKAASSTAPDTWSSYDQAVWAVENGYYDHIGFVFADTGIVGIDIDVGFDGGLLTPLCVDILQHCQSYTEKSKSGRGVHILLHGSLPFDGKNNLQGIEIYKSRRFFIMTGKQMLFSTIENNQDAIDYVVDKYFPITEKNNEGKRPLVEKIYTPIYPKPQNSKVQLRPEYPPILSGSRNISLTSLAGAMWNTGYSPKDIYKELVYVNQKCCTPPLHDRELQTITESISRYRR